MLNPSDISSKRFDKSPVLGYKTEDVEHFLEQVAQDYAVALNEKLELERKIEALADKLEEYRRDEDSLKSAVFEAQKLGSSIVRDSKAKAERILQEANEKAAAVTAQAQAQAAAQMNEATRRSEEITASTDQRLVVQQEAFERLKTEVASFKKRMMSTYKAHIELISSLPDPSQEPKTVAAPPPAAAERIPSYHAPESAPKETSETTLPVNETSRVSSEKTKEVSQASRTDQNSASVGRVTPSFSGNDEKDTASIAEAIQEESTKEMPKIRSDLKFGALKFGENYSLAEEKENKKNRKRG